MTDTKCLKCENEFYEEHLAILKEGDEFFKGCPYCGTDAYLQDLKEDE